MSASRGSRISSNRNRQGRVSFLFEAPFRRTRERRTREKEKRNEKNDVDDYLDASSASLKKIFDGDNSPDKIKLDLSQLSRRLPGIEDENLIARKEHLSALDNALSACCRSRVYALEAVGIPHSSPFHDVCDFRSR